MARQVRVGMAVTSARGERLGRVVRVDGEHALISRGLLSPKEFLISLSQAEVRDGALLIAPERLQPWEPREEAAEAPAWAADGEPPAVEVALHEEELFAEKHPKVRGHVRVRKTVVTEERVVTVRVRREELRFERVDRPPEGVRAGDTAALLGAPLEEHAAYLPLYDEEIEIVKRPKLREWVRVSKELVSEPKTYVASVRKETATVEGDPPLTVHDESAR